MSIKVECENCGTKRKVNQRLAGRTIRCPGCDQPLAIPTADVQETGIQETSVVEAEVVEADAAVVEAELTTPEFSPEKAVAAQPVASVEQKPDTETLMEVEPVLIPDPRADVASAPIAVKAIPVHANDDGDDSDPESPGLVSPAQRGAGVAAAAGAAVSAKSRPVAVRPAEKRSVDPEPEPKRDDDEDDDGVPPRQQREDGELDMTPMVDVTFLLLIFFMVTASFSLQKSIQMPRQNSDLPSMSNQEEETEELDPIELEIDESGAFLVLAPEWERETPGKQNLITALKQAIGDNRDGMKLDVKVHENAELQMLVDGMDAGTIAGFSQIQVTEVDGFD